MDTKYKRLLHILSDNEFHSGQEIGEQLQMTRGGVWKLIQNLLDVGFEIIGISRRGYQLTHPITFLTRPKIFAHLPLNLQSDLKKIEIYDVLESTNTYLLQKMYEYKNVPRVCISEMQTYGRGRYGRRWHSPYAQNIYLSLLWRLSTHATDLHALPLVICLAVVSVLNTLSLPATLQLKWPNDIYYQGKKLAGVLIETLNEVNNNSQVVIGIGLNVNMRYAKNKTIDQSWISLFQILGTSIDRNILIAKLLNACERYLQLFNKHGFSMFQNEWQRYDITQGKSLQIRCHDQLFEGIASGIDKHGMLCISSYKNKKMYFSIGDMETTLLPK